ncbi:acetate kinase [Phormidium yuhuli AB48]|uniref:Acetate kinase n=1 Tax=Phormidium yuhuli AB48 TaxID=2940671 RepID=A0ABY5AL87_9CYAN|nr:acetate kinase [Phormidium yuhuli]USR89974.1 acetate kinase [Phormidium yuhuli AB48]
MKVLVLNAGSSSQKSCLYDLPEGAFPETAAEPIWEAMVDWGIHPDYGQLTVTAQGTEHEIRLSRDTPNHGLEEMLATLVQGETPVLGALTEISIVGHRVVHGGDRYCQATLIDEAVKQTIEELIPLAPNHNPAHLEEILGVEAVLGDVPQVAVFDTAFHTSIPAAAATYPIPYDWFEKGIRRYGFHGISHRYCAQQAATLVGKPLESLRMITAHLGNGCSLTAVRGGESVNTTMGFTPLEGLMMGTRSGSIDPAIPLYLMTQMGVEASEVDRLLNKQSGLKGIFGPSGDLREILQAREGGDERARLAFEMYVLRLQGAIAALIPQLGGLDVLAFTAGVGENSAAVRSATCAGFEFLGLELDESKNQGSAKNSRISTANSGVAVVVVHAQEDWAIARECWQLARCP